MVSTSAQDVQPTLTPTPRRQAALYVAFFVLVLILGAVAYFNIVFAVLLAGALVVVGFFQAFSFRILFLLLLALFFLISPAIPLSEKHFSKPIGGGGLFLQDAVLLLFFAVALFDYLKQPRLPRPSKWALLERLFAIYTIMFFASAIYGAINGNTLTYLFGDVRDFLYLLLFYVYLHFFKTDTDIAFAFNALIGVGLLFAALSLIDNTLIRGFVRYNSGISFLLVASTLALLAKVLTRGAPFSMLSTSLVLLVMLAGLLISFTRGLYLGFFAGFVMMLLVVGFRRSFKFAIGLGLLALAAVGTTLALGLSLDTLISLTTYRGSSAVGNLDVSSAERVLEVLAVLDELPNHWLFGKGAGATVAVYRFGDSNIKEGIVDWWFIHNNYAQVLHKSGCLGLLIFLMLWIGALLQGIRLFQRAPSSTAQSILLATVGTLTAYMVSSITSPVMTYINTNFVNALLFASIAFFDRLCYATSHTDRRD